MGVMSTVIQYIYEIRKTVIQNLFQGGQLQREVKYLYNKMASYKPKVCWNCIIIWFDNINRPLLQIKKDEKKEESADKKEKSENETTTEEAEKKEERETIEPPHSDL